MSQLWQGEKMSAVTKVQAGPCVVTQIKDSQKDGYQAVQLGFGQKKEKKIKKPQAGHLAKVKAASPELAVNLAILREFRGENNLTIGDLIDVGTFVVGDKVQAEGISKGKGFQGVVKRHGFHGHNTTHGTKDQVRTTGSIGASGVQHVLKGMRMPGRMGGGRVTVKNLEIMQIDQASNILYLKGAVPGARNSLVLISGPGEMIVKAKEEAKTEPKAEEQVSKK